jgi:acyl-CoA dehydrogenase
MVIGIPDELIQLRDSVAKFVEREVRPVEERYREQVLEEGTIPTDVAHAERVKLRQKSVAAGFYAMHMPEEVGGMGVNTLGLALCREAVCASALLLADRGGVLASVEGPRPMLMNLNEAQREEYLYPLMRAEREACFGLTEPDAGSDATSIRTKAVKEGEYWRINGRKHFITNGQYADFI